MESTSAAPVSFLATIHRTTTDADGETSLVLKVPADELMQILPLTIARNEVLRIEVKRGM